MKIFGKSLGEYVRFQAPILGLIVVVGLARLGLSLAGQPNSRVKWLSVTVALLVGLVYYAVRVPTSGFGSYKQLLPLLFIQSIVAEAIVIVGIILAAVGGRENIYSAPEYSPAGGGVGFHIFGHVVFGSLIGPLVGWLIAAFIMFVTKKVAPSGQTARTA